MDEKSLYLEKITAIHVLKGSKLKGGQLYRHINLATLWGHYKPIFLELKVHNSIYFSCSVAIGDKSTMAAIETHSFRLDIQLERKAKTSRSLHLFIRGY